MQDGRPTVTVVIACFDLGRYLGEAVGSVLAQTFRDYELVVVDDGSTDPRTLDVLAQYERDGIQVLRRPHGGVSAAKNAGIEIARGEYIVVVDADDVLLPRYLERTVPHLERGTDVGIVATDSRTFGKRRGVYRATPYDPVKLLWRNVVSGSGSLFRRSCWEAAGGYALDGFEDWNLWISIVERGWKWAVVPETLYRFRVRSGTVSETARARRSELLPELVALHRETYEAHVADIVVQMDEALRAAHRAWPRPWLRWILRRA
jgi:glycosyltransferase involved in cell wall biosynthesis